MGKNQETRKGPRSQGKRDFGRGREDNRTHEVIGKYSGNSFVF